MLANRFSDVTEGQAAGNGGNIIWPVGAPVQEEEAIAQEEGLEDDLEPAGVGGNVGAQHKKRFSYDAGIIEIT